MGKKLFNPVKKLSQKAHIKSLDQYEKQKKEQNIVYLIKIYITAYI